MLALQGGKFANLLIKPMNHISPNSVIGSSPAICFRIYALAHYIYDDHGYEIYVYSWDG